jgi:hypothetical protein
MAKKGKNKQKSKQDNSKSIDEKHQERKSKNFKHKKLKGNAPDDAQLYAAVEAGTCVPGMVVIIVCKLKRGA